MRTDQRFSEHSICASFVREEYVCPGEGDRSNACRGVGFDVILVIQVRVMMQHHRDVVLDDHYLVCMHCTFYGAF